MKRWVLFFGAPVIGVFCGGTATAVVAALAAVGNCSSSAAAPSSAAASAIPADLLSIYEQVGARYGIPWEVLAGIGQEECDQGQNPSPACTIQPGSQGPGTANSASASGLMQIGVGGASGDAYDQLRGNLPDPSLGPHDPTTSIELAALVLIKDKGAPANQSISAYLPAVTAYNGTGPAAVAYAHRVIADATSYASNGVSAVSACETSDNNSTLIIPGDQAKILPDGEAEVPANAPAVVQEMIAAGNRLIRFPYSWGGGHGDPAQTMSQTDPNPAAWPGSQENGGGPGYDCSSATSYVLWGGGYGDSLLGGSVWDSTELENVGRPGPGRWVTIYANAGHAYIEVALSVNVR